MRSRAVRLWLARGSLALTAAAVGCGGSGQRIDATRVVADAGAATAATRGFRVVFKPSLTLPEGAVVVMPAAGWIDARDQRGQLTIDMTPLVRVYGKHAIYRAEQIFDRSGVYMRMPWLRKRLGGKLWISFTTAHGNGALVPPSAGSVFGRLTQHPLHLLDQLRVGARNAADLGRDIVRGMPMLHYRLIVDLGRWARRASARDPQSARYFERRFRSAAGGSSYPAEVWIDRRGLVRRLSLAISFEAPLVRGHPILRFTETADFYDFGSRVTFRRPAPRATVNLGG